MLKEFRDFAMRGNVVDLAVGFIMGVAFAAIVNSLVNDIIMPPIGLLLGGVDFNNLFWVIKPFGQAYPSLAQAKAAGAVSINYGAFINYIIIFVIVAAVLFVLVRSMNKMKKAPAPAAPTTKECPFCFTSIPIKATRCPNCTSDLTKK